MSNLLAKVPAFYTQCRTTDFLGGLERGVLHSFLVQNFLSGINLNPPILLKLNVDVY